MKVETLNDLWQQKHIGGSIQKRGSHYTVTFSADSKVYKYSAASNYDLAERLELIPEVDITKESKRIANVLQSQDEVVSALGCADTIRGLYNPNIRSEYCGTDQYDRPLARYWIDTTHNAWS